MPVVKKYKSEVVSVKQQAENIFTVEFKPTESKFRFMPGQFLHLALDEYDP
jgi:ferredoxin-NADP reductase